MQKRYLSHKDIKGIFAGVRQRAIAIYNEINEHNFILEFETEKWNICQHFDHLLKFGEYHIPHIDKALLNTIESRQFTDERLMVSMDEEKLLSRIENTENQLLAPSEMFIPDHNLPKGKAFIKFISLQDLFISQLNMADGYSLAHQEVTVKVDHGFRLRTGAAFLLIAAYENRHLTFVEELKEEIVNENLNLTE